MASYVARRMAWTIVVLWAIGTVTFGITFLSPIDPARAYAGFRASPEVIEEVTESFGLDQPIWTQYGRYVGRTIQGDLGVSFASGQPVLDRMLDRLPATALLASAAMLIQLLLGIPLGVVAALHRHSALDRIILTFSLFGVVTPAFVLGFVLLYLLAFKVQIFPLGGSDSLDALVLPALTLGIPGAAWYARMLRSTTLNILSEEYVRMARAKGLPERVVIVRHVLRNAISPVVAMVGTDSAVLLGGVLIIERVFAWPGIGDQAWRAVLANDVPMIIGTVLFAAFFVALFNLLADLLNAALDPRVKYT
jgi:peptide/nickel transport system permease protein